MHMSHLVIILSADVEDWTVAVATPVALAVVARWELVVTFVAVVVPVVAVVAVVVPVVAAVVAVVAAVHWANKGPVRPVAWSSVVVCISGWDDDIPVNEDLGTDRSWCAIADPTSISSVVQADVITVAVISVDNVNKKAAVWSVWSVVAVVPWAIDDVPLNVE